MKKTLLKIAGAFAVPALVIGLAVVAPGDDAAAQVNEGIRKVSNADVAKGGDADSIIKNIIDFALMAIVVVSVFMLILGGFKYTTSNGDSNKVTSAKNTIMYAIIGLVIAIFSYAIVNFVVSKLGVN